MIDNQSNEIILIIHSDKTDDRKTRDHVEAIDSFDVAVIDLKKDKLSEERLVEIADQLDAEVDDLVDVTYADRVKIGRVKGLPEEDSLRLLVQNPILIATPIIIIGDHAFQFESSLEFIRESAAFTGLKENPAASVEGTDS